MFPEKSPPGEGWHTILTQTEITSESLTPQIDRGEAGAQGDALYFLLVSQQVNRTNSSKPGALPCWQAAQPQARLAQPGSVVTLSPPELKTPCFHLVMEEASDNMRYFYFAQQWNSASRKLSSTGEQNRKRIEKCCISYLATSALEFKQFCVCPFESTRLHGWRKHPISQGAMFQKQKKST